MATLNRVQLIGNLGRDPETVATNSGTVIVKFPLATSKKWKTQNGQNHEKTTWHNIDVFGNAAKFCQSYLKKGQSVFIEGEIETNSWEKDGVKQYRTSIRAFSVQSLTPATNTGNQSQANPYSDNSSGLPPMDDDLPY